MGMNERPEARPGMVMEGLLCESTWELCENVGESLHQAWRERVAGPDWLGSF